MIRTLSFSLIVSLGLLSCKPVVHISRPEDVTDAYVKYIIARGETYYLVLLNRGPKTDQTQAELAELQMKHLRYLMFLRAQGKLVLVGPTDQEDAKLRGICIFDVQTQEEAEKLISSDPAVKAGRLVYEVYPWFGLPGDGLPK